MIDGGSNFACGQTYRRPYNSGVLAYTRIGVRERGDVGLRDIRPICNEVEFYASAWRKCVTVMLMTLIS